MNLLRTLVVYALLVIKQDDGIFWWLESMSIAKPVDTLFIEFMLIVQIELHYCSYCFLTHLGWYIWLFRIISYHVRSYWMVLAAFLYFWMFFAIFCSFLLFLDVLAVFCSFLLFLRFLAVFSCFWLFLVVFDCLGVHIKLLEHSVQSPKETSHKTCHWTCHFSFNSFRNLLFFLNRNPVKNIIKKFPTKFGKKCGKKLVIFTTQSAVSKIVKENRCFVRSLKNCI